jgi:hypothetical protein
MMNMTVISVNTVPQYIKVLWPVYVWNFNTQDGLHKIFPTFMSIDLKFQIKITYRALQDNIVVEY